MKLEKLSPAIYGWLVWGGGFRFLRRLSVIVVIIVILTVTFLAGGWLL